MTQKEFLFAAIGAGVGNFFVGYVWFGLWLFAWGDGDWPNGVETAFHFFLSVPMRCLFAVAFGYGAYKLAQQKPPQP